MIGELPYCHIGMYIGLDTDKIFLKRNIKKFYLYNI